MSTVKKIINCPNCQKKDTWNPSNPFRPFCSERCKLIDLGEWASEGHAIPGEPVDPDLLEEEQLKQNKQPLDD